MPFWSMLVAGPGETNPIPLGHYRLPLRCQTIMIVNLPISGSSTSNLIIEILLSASKRWPGREPGFPDRSSSASFENPFFQSPQERTPHVQCANRRRVLHLPLRLRNEIATISATLCGLVQTPRVTSRYAFAKILICQRLAGESGGPVSNRLRSHHFLACGHVSRQ